MIRKRDYTRSADKLHETLGQSIPKKSTYEADPSFRFQGIEYYDNTGIEL